MTVRDNFAEVVFSRHPGGDDFHDIVATLRRPAP